VAELNKNIADKELKEKVREIVLDSKLAAYNISVESH